MQITEDIDRILDLGYSIATESNYVTLFDMILDSCVRFTYNSFTLTSESRGAAGGFFRYI